MDEQISISKNKIRTLKIIIYTVLCVITALAVVYVVFGFDIFKIEDSDLIKAVKDKAISANVLLIRVAEESVSGDVTVTSTSYSAGHSGVVFRKEDNRYYVLTALHAVDMENPKMLVLRHDQPTYNAYVEDSGYVGFSIYYEQFPETVIEYYNEAYDLAVLSFVSEYEFTVLPIASAPPEYNELVVAIGNPHENTRNAITTGRITSRYPVPFGDEAGKNQHNVITHSAKISGGSSGGALLNKNMEIVGINLGGSENMFRFIEGKAMPCDKIIEFLRGINIVL